MLYSQQVSEVRVFATFWVIREFSFYWQVLKCTGGRDERGYFNSEGMVLNCRFVFTLAGLQVVFFFLHTEKRGFPETQETQRAWFYPWIVVVL